MKIMKSKNPLTLGFHRLSGALAVVLFFTACGFGLNQAAASSDAWTENYESAKQTASESQKQVLLNFTGSDWCPPCMAMERNVLNEKAFLEGVEESIVLVTLDFPRRKAQEESIKERNQGLAQSYGVRGFPTFILLDAEGNEIRRTVGARHNNPEAFLNWVKNG